MVMMQSVLIMTKLFRGLFLLCLEDEWKVCFGVADTNVLL